MLRLWLLVGLGQLRARLPAVLCLVVSLFEPTSARAMDPTQIAELMKSASVLILTESVDEDGETQGGGGTGYYISPDLIITNAHVAVEGRELLVVPGRDLSQGKKAEVLARDSAVDLALIRSPFRSIYYLQTFSSRMPKIGSAVYAYGNPVGTIGTFTSGVVSNLRAEGGIDKIDFTAPISPGNSGGPLVDSEGALLGTVNSAIEGPGAQNLNRAIPTKYLVRLLLPLAYRLTELGFTPKQERELVGDCSFVTPTVPYAFDVTPAQKATDITRALQKRITLLDGSARPPFFYERTEIESGQVVFGHSPLVGPQLNGRTWGAVREWIARDFLGAFLRTDASDWRGFKLSVTGDAGAVKATFSKEDPNQLEAFSAIYLFPYCRYWVYEQWPKVEGETTQQRKQRKNFWRTLEQWPKGVGEGDLWVDSPFFLENSQHFFRFGAAATNRLTALMRSPVSSRPNLGVALMAALPFLVWSGFRFRKGAKWSGIFLIMFASSILKQAGKTEVWPLHGFKREEWKSATEETPMQQHIPPGVIAVNEFLRELENETSDKPDESAVDAVGDEQTPEAVASALSASTPAPSQPASPRTYAFRSMERAESGIYKISFYSGSGNVLWQHCSPDCASFGALYDGHPFFWDEAKNEISFVDSLGRRFACKVIACP